MCVLVTSSKTIVIRFNKVNFRIILYSREINKNCLGSLTLLGEFPVYGKAIEYLKLHENIKDCSNILEHLTINDILGAQFSTYKDNLYYFYSLLKSEELMNHASITESFYNQRFSIEIYNFIKSLVKKYPCDFNNFMRNDHDPGNHYYSSILECKMFVRNFDIT